RLAEAAELAGKRRVDLVADPGRAVILGQPGQRTRGEPPDDADRRALDLGFDLTRRIDARDLDHDIEPELEIRDPGVEHRRVMVTVDLTQILHAFDAGGEEARIA